MSVAIRVVYLGVSNDDSPNTHQNSVCSKKFSSLCPLSTTCFHPLQARLVIIVQDYDKVHRLSLEWQLDSAEAHCHPQSSGGEEAACSFEVSASPKMLVNALQVTNQVTLAQLPLIAPDIGRPDKIGKQHTRLVAHLAVAQDLTTGYRVDLDFGLPEHQLSPRSYSQQTKLINTQLRKQIDAWLAALVEAAGQSYAKLIVCSSYVLQAAARAEYSNVLGHERLAFQRAPFQQAPHVVLRMNTDYCDLTSGLVWHALRNIQCLDLQFEVDGTQQRHMLRTMPAGVIHCLSVSGCDVHAPGMLKALCAALRRISDLESFQLGAIAQMFSDIDERPFSQRQIGCLERSLLRNWRIVSIDFFNKSVQEEVNCLPLCFTCFTCTVL